MNNNAWYCTSLKRGVNETSQACLRQRRHDIKTQPNFPEKLDEQSVIYSCSLLALIACCSSVGHKLAAVGGSISHWLEVSEIFVSTD